MSFPVYQQPQDIGVEWLGEVPSHWQVRRLGGVFTERREKVSDTEFPALSVTKQGIVPQLATAAKTDDNDNRKGVRAGDFVINSRSDRKGSSGLSQLDGSVSLINTVITPDAILDPAFVHFLLRSVAFQEEFYRYGKGIVADLWSTNYSEMKNILLAFPERSEQAVIAAFLDRETAKIDALIEEQRRLVALLKEKRQAVISHAVTNGLDPHAPMKDSGIEWLGEVPAHWEVRLLSSVSTKITNGYVGPTRDILREEGVRYLQSLHIKSNTIRFDTPYFVDKQWSEAHAKSILQVGDVLIVQTGDIGQSAVVTSEFEGCNCHALIIVSPLRSVLSGDWLAWLLNGAYGFNSLLAIQTGALHPHLNCGNVKGLAIPVPPLSDQAVIVDYIATETSRFGDLIAEAGSAIELLIERRAALISAAVTGKIDVRGSAKVLPFRIDRTRARALVGTEIIERSAGQPTFGRVKFQKVAFLAEGHVGISELAGCYTRAAAGPLDGALIEDMERGAHSIAGITVDQAGGTGTMVSYRLGQERDTHRQELADWLGSDRTAKLDKLIADFAPLSTKQAEAVATLYGIWNDLLSEGASPSDDEIITGFLNDWHPEKRDKFRASELPDWLGWMRRHGIVPTGSRPKTTTGRLFV
jgi:restriction endonuclease S subunit